MPFRLERILRAEVAERKRHRGEATICLGRRLRQLANEREKLLRAYYADALDVQTLRRKRARINAEVAKAESQLATDGEKLRPASGWPESLTAIEEREIRDQLRGTERPSDAVRALAAIRGLREHASDLRAVLRHVDPEDQRKIFSRTIRSVTWLPDEERLELRLVLPEAEDEPAEGRVDSVRARGGIRTHTLRRATGFRPVAAAVFFATRAKRPHYTSRRPRCSSRGRCRSERGSSGRRS